MKVVNPGWAGIFEEVISPAPVWETGPVLIGDVVAVITADWFRMLFSSKDDKLYTESIKVPDFTSYILYET